jgi:UDP-N-acetylmuramoyl-L-alanyl-D-glutamate--2,6-diaminopimelate ligase
MDRIFPEDYDCAIFTNLSQDHLDFHETMDEYFHAKALLFRDLKENAVAIINVDDPYGKKLLGLTKARVFTYGMHSEAHFGGSIDALSITGTNFTVDGKNYTTHLVGEHNVYNLLSAYSFARALGLNNNAFERAMDSVKKIPGRFERVAFDRDYHVFVDYAHTPDALGHLLEAANALKKGRIITVFGCGGDRDRGKRPLMGNVVEKKSDICIVTSDNPRTEDPLAIIGDIKGGLSRSDHLIIPDRRSAIFKAVELVRADDIVLIAGKGHEDYQILKDSIIHFDDREVALEAMEYFGK